MIAKSRKFPMRTDFYSFRKHASSLRSYGFTIFFGRSSEPKAGVVISKKSLSKAVDRNKLRRQLFPLVYEIASQKKMNIVVLLAKHTGAHELTLSLLNKLKSL